MGNIDFTRLLEPVEISTLCESPVYSIKTKDFVWIRSVGAYGSDNSYDLSNAQRNVYHQTSATDYALMNGAGQFRKQLDKDYGFFSPSNELLRNYETRGGNDRGLQYVSGSEGYAARCPNTSIHGEIYGIRPCMRLNLEYFLELFRQDKSTFDVKPVKNIYLGDELYYTLALGVYPQKKLRDQSSVSTQTIISQPANDCKKYLGYLKDDLQFTVSSEFPISGTTKCVDVATKERDSLIGPATFADSKKVPDQPQILFARVSPITWVIRNWDALPKEINPNGNGTAKHIDIMTDKLIMAGIPYHMILNNKKMETYLWQNSTVRGVLNGINVNYISNNGNPQYSCAGGGDFSQSPSFLSTAFDLTYEQIKFMYDVKVFDKEYARPTSRQVNTKKAYGVKVASEPMNVSDQIKFYVDKGKAFMLHGVSGVGKTRRIEDIDPDYVAILLRKGILPEEVIGKTIYPSGENEHGVWVPPTWFTELTEKCKAEPDRNHVLFIDEITNVNATEQSLVYDIVLNNQIGPNKGKLPKNVVLASAGNSVEESSAAYNMPEPLFRRFEGHVYLEPNLEDLLEWGKLPHPKNADRTNLHPLVLAFLQDTNGRYIYSPYDNDSPPEFAIDPRGWEQISDIIYNNNGKISKELIVNKAGRQIANRFIDFARDSFQKRTTTSTERVRGVGVSGVGISSVLQDIVKAYSTNGSKLDDSKYLTPAEIVDDDVQYLTPDEIADRMFDEIKNL